MINVMYDIAVNVNINWIVPSSKVNVSQEVKVISVNAVLVVLCMFLIFVFWEKEINTLN